MIDRVAPEFDIERVRQDFPVLQRLSHEKPLAYLDNAATSQKPKQVIDAISHYYTHYNANVHRGVHQLSCEATQGYERARDKMQAFINAPAREEIIFVRGCTEAINLCAHSYLRPRLQAGDEVLISFMEHHSNLVPWQILCHEVGATLKVIPMNQRGELILDDLATLISERTKLVALSHVSNAIGTINPIKTIIEQAHARDIPVLIDGAQAAPHMAIDVQALDCDFYTISGHKMFAPTGIGVLYAKRQYLERMQPYQSGGEMVKMVTFDKTLYNDLPNQFEAGTPNIAGAIGLGAAIDYLNAIGLDNIARYESHLRAYAEQTLAAIEGIQLVGQAADKAAVVAFLVQDIHAHDVGTILDQQGIAVRAGHHCAMPVMDFYGVSALSRASFAFYNTYAEVDKLALGLNEVQAMFA